MMRFGDILKTSFALLRARFWPLMGLSLLFAAFQAVCSVVVTLGAAVFGITVLGMAGSGLDNPDGLFGMGLGAAVFVAVSSAIYAVAVIAHQAAMVTLAAPSEPASFGAALGRGIRSAPTFLGVILITILVYVLIAAGLAAMPEDVRIIFELLLIVAILPVAVYLGCRFAVLVPVVVVEREFGPLAAIVRCWGLTRGKVWTILRMLIGFALVAGVLFGAVMSGLIMLVSAISDGMGAGAAIALVIFALFIPLAMVTASLAATFTAALHDGLTGGQSETLEAIFA